MSRVFIIIFLAVAGMVTCRGESLNDKLVQNLVRSNKFVFIDGKPADAAELEHSF